MLCLTGPTTESDKLDATREFADYLRKSSWKFGDCNNDLVIVISEFDRKVSVCLDDLIG